MGSILHGILFIQLLQYCFCTIEKANLDNLFEKTHKERVEKYAKEHPPGQLNFDLFGLNYFRQFSYPFDFYSGSSVAIHNYALTGIEVARKMFDIDTTAQPTFAQQFRAPERFCPFQHKIFCDPKYPYRIYDGSCNNLKYPWWGQSNTPFKRYMRPSYSDPAGLDAPRKSIDGFDLPNPKEISCQIHTDIPYLTELLVTHMHEQFGQFITHDFTLTAHAKDPFGNSVDCSDCKVTDACQPIFLPTHSRCSNCATRMTKPCMDFIRSSASYPDIYCTIGQREQLNLQTSFLDGSHVYGSDEATAEKLRDRSKGRGLMKSVFRGNKRKDFLPNDENAICIDSTKREKCFLTGDERSNMNPTLISMHMIFVREHNRVANILADLNPFWDDEIIFQETRRIIIAFLQHITYYEWLPKILGATTMQAWDLYPSLNGYFTGYDIETDPRTANEWATAAQRFGHSTVSSYYSRVDSNYTKTGHILLQSSFFRPHAIYDQPAGGMDSLVRGLLKDPMQKADEWVSDALTKHLFENFNDQGHPFYFDLIAINIARGRDHGLPGYTEVRKWCHLSPVFSWDDLYNIMLPDTVNSLRGLYRYVEDIDLYTGGLSELKNADSLVGPTFSCLIARQFKEWKYGDRFWYETNLEPGRFTHEQLFEIKKVSLSRILCDNLENTPTIQRDAFLSTNYPGNELFDCNLIPFVDLRKWQARFGKK